jgi:hypothetical protein
LRKKKKRELFPSRIVAAVEQAKNSLSTTYLVVQCCVRKLEEEAAMDIGSEYVNAASRNAANSSLFQMWIFQHEFYVVPIASYSSPA